MLKYNKMKNEDEKLKTYEQLVQNYKKIKDSIPEDLAVTKEITEIIRILDEKFILYQCALASSNSKSANEISITIHILLDSLKSTYKLICK